MQSNYNIHNIIQYIKWYYSGKTVQEIVELHEKKFSNIDTPTDHEIKWWILSFETNGCVNASHYAVNISESDIDNVPNVIDISYNLNSSSEHKFDTTNDLNENVDFLQSTFEDESLFFVNNDNKANVDVDIKCEVDLNEEILNRKQDNERAEGVPNKEPTDIKREQSFITSHKKKFKRNDRNCCIFCKKIVSNFPRHLLRRHESEPKVHQIFSYPMRSSKRKNELILLRNKGNLEAGIYKQTRRSHKILSKCNPCPYCLGYFSSLARHRRRCQKIFLPVQSRILDIDPVLAKLVLPYMRNDYVKLAAKNDLLICDLGARFYRSRSGHAVTALTSRKMRQLAKIVIDLRIRNSQFQYLIDILKPSNYDLLVATILNLAGYNWETNQFKWPNFAISVGKSLKKCCEIALENISRYQSSISVSDQDLSEFLTVFENKWKQDVLNAAMDTLIAKKRPLSYTLNSQEISNLTKESSLLKNNGKRRRLRLRQPWTRQQKNIVVQFFRKHILQKRVPNIKECQCLKNKYPKLLANKSYQSIKSFIQHKYSYIAKKNIVKIDY